MTLLFIQKYWRLLLMLLGLLGAFGVGFFSAKKTVKPVEIIQERLVEKVVEKEVIKIVEVEKKITSKKTTEVKKPDGTVITNTEEKTESEVSKKTEEKKEVIAEKKTEKQTSPAPTKDYKIGALTTIDRKYSVTAGWNAFGPLWLESQYNITQKEASVGLSIQF
jgi:hypothetical protein